jgi:hypothetical protein
VGEVSQTPADREDALGQKLETVSIDARYQSAWNEVNTRITQRQNALYIFLSISLAIIAFTFSKATFDDASTRALILMPIPLSAFTLALLNAKHDQTIALLRSFLKECERAGLAQRSHVLLPLSYNDNPDFADHAKRFRRYHDWAFVTAIITICFVAIILLILSKDVLPDTSSTAPLAGKVVSFAILYFAAYFGFTAAAAYWVWKPAIFEEKSPRTRRWLQRRGDE